MIERLAIAPEVQGCRYRDHLHRHKLPREVVYALQAYLWSAAMYAREILGVGLACDAQPGFTEFGAQANQTVGNRSQRYGERQFYVEQQWNECFVDAFGSLLQQFVDLQAMQDGNLQRPNCREVLAQGYQIQERIIFRRLGEPIQRLLQQRMRGGQCLFAAHFGQDSLYELRF
jgi:hypothetical protein